MVSAKRHGPNSALASVPCICWAISRSVPSSHQGLLACRHIGVDHVYLHDNNEDGGQQASQLRDFIEDGYLTVTQVDGENQQIEVYEHCVQTIAPQYAWLAAIDIDEFIVITDPDAQAEPWPLKAVLNRFRFRPGEPLLRRVHTDCRLQSLCTSEASRHACVRIESPDRLCSRLCVLLRTLIAVLGQLWAPLA